MSPRILTIILLAPILASAQIETPIHVLKIDDSKDVVFLQLPKHFSVLVTSVELPPGIELQASKLTSPADPIADATLYSIPGQKNNGISLHGGADEWASFSISSDKDSGEKRRQALEGMIFKGEFGTWKLKISSTRNGKDVGVAKSMEFLEHRSFDVTGDLDQRIVFGISTKSSVSGEVICEGFANPWKTWRIVEDQKDQIELTSGDGKKAIVELKYTPGGEDLPADFPNQDEDWKNAAMIYFKLDGRWFQNASSMNF